MQTFLPFSSFLKSAHCLDYKRLGKQRVEAKQILEINLFKLSEFWWECPSCGKQFHYLPEKLCPNCFHTEPGIYMLYKSKEGKDKLDKIPWENHPAVRMWRGYEIALAFYGYIICGNWRYRGYVDNLQPFFKEVAKELMEKEKITFAYFLDGYLPNEYLPKWLGRREFHLSHQSNLLRKNREYYWQYFGYSVPDNLPYEWNREFWR